MKINLTLRPATTGDAAAIAAIYRPFVLHSAVSFEAEPPTAEGMAGRIEATQRTHLWLVCTLNQEVVGYAYGGQHRSRTAYQWTTEVSVYVAEGYRKRGIARGLYTALLAGLALQGYTLALAGITLPNPASERFHEAFGFVPFAHYENVGYKFGQWRTTAWLRKPLGELPTHPEAPKAFRLVEGSAEWEAAVAEASLLIKI